LTGTIGHFFAVASHIMRRILIDHARRRKRARHGGGHIAFPLNEAPSISTEPDEGILDLDAALITLSRFDARKAARLEMVYFGGMTYPEIATALEVSEATVHRELKLDRAWLRQELQCHATVSTQ
jgi:RNA polymerase sigma-70 factor (ECF subfamily)